MIYSSKRIRGWVPLHQVVEAAFELLLDSSQIFFRELWRRIILGVEELRHLEHFTRRPGGGNPREHVSFALGEVEAHLPQEQEEQVLAQHVGVGEGEGDERDGLVQRGVVVGHGLLQMFNVCVLFR